ncbi:MAG: hypothetical protein Unbinned706contig1000_13 [Prokaryotic dsDNA virus sp.]|nr:MAG: hypothetical protein Unbinned706contig1000_13 [Prokaryotic dsDNA virus sp.]|tara:strand:+ start:15178 stop:15384 length:207 start_codon:yes stop_codon:yes gene_type:complete
MKTYKSSDLTHKRKEVMAIAAAEGAHIRELKTNGDVKREFILITKEEFIDMDIGFDSNNEPRVYPEEF